MTIRLGANMDLIINLAMQLVPKEWYWPKRRVIPMGHKVTLGFRTDMVRITQCSLGQEELVTEKSGCHCDV